MIKKYVTSYGRWNAALMVLCAALLMFVVDYKRMSIVDIVLIVMLGAALLLGLVRVVLVAIKLKRV